MLIDRTSQDDFDFDFDPEFEQDMDGPEDPEVLPSDEGNDVERRSRISQTREGLNALLVSDLMEFYGVTHEEALKAVRESVRDPKKSDRESK